jgi:hypothetical protein
MIPIELNIFFRIIYHFQVQAGLIGKERGICGYKLTEGTVSISGIVLLFGITAFPFNKWPAEPLPA